MCFNGNFALSMMLEPAVIAPVLAQPSLPLDQPDRLELSKNDVDQINQRLSNEGLEVLAYRFEGDSFYTAARFAAYKNAFGDSFHARTVSDIDANAEVPAFTYHHVPTAHSVFTSHLIDSEGKPTIRARDEVLAFFEAN